MSELHEHNWSELVECDSCGDDHCGVKCSECDLIDWACDE